MLTVKYSITIRNRNRKSAKWYGRIRQDGRERFIPMKDRADAEKWLNRQKYLYGEYTGGNLQESEILTVDSTPVIAQKRASGTVVKVRDCLDGWEKKLRLEGKRETSLATYGRALRLLLDQDMEITGLTPEKVGEIMKGRTGLKANTRRFYTKALGSFFSFLAETYNVRDLEKSLPQVRTEAGDRTVWSRYDMDEIIRCASCKDSVRTLEFREYLTMLSRIGSRQGETAELTWADLDEVTGLVHFRASITKGRAERWCPLPTELRAELEMRRGAPGEKIFRNIGADQQSRYAALQRAIRKAGVPRGGLHTFRHSCATLLYRKSNCNIQLTSRMLGHSPTVAMQYYVHGQSIEDMRELVEDD